MKVTITPSTDKKHIYIVILSMPITHRRTDAEWAEEQQRAKIANERPRRVVKTARDVRVEIDIGDCDAAGKEAAHLVAARIRSLFGAERRATRSLHLTPYQQKRIEEIKTEIGFIPTEVG